MTLEFILLLGLVIPGLWVLQLARVRVHNNVERLSLSYILSLALMFSVLYLGGIMKAFNVASFIVLAIVVVSFVHLFVLFAMRVLRSPHQFKTSLFLRISARELVVITSTIGLLSIYVMFLSSRAILDSDAKQYYLPMAREIVRGNGFTYSTGYDYNILLKPIGASVLYAWVYVVSGSTLSEAFRLMPLASIFMLVILNYAIATLATKSQTVGIISAAVFLVLPFHDRFLLYNAFYPDTFYYPLIFAAIYLLLEYFQTRRDWLLFWTGMALGVAGLLKAQTVYFLVAILLIIIVSKLRSRKLSLALCCLTPFYILVPNILAEGVQHEGLRLSIPSITPTQLGLFLFLAVLSGICYLVATHNSILGRKVDSDMIRSLIKKMVLLLAPFAILSSLWYVNNLMKFGSLLYTSSVNLPNYDWALGVLKPTEHTYPTANMWHYSMYFASMFVDPAVMGYIWLVPLLAGLIYMLRARLEIFNVLLLFETIFAITVFSQVVYGIPNVGTPTYNPRDILLLAPLLTTILSIGIVSLSSTFRRKSDNIRSIVIPLLLVAYFGIMSYTHSVLVWFTSGHFPATIVGELVKNFAFSYGLTLTQTSFQLPPENRAIFIGENAGKVVTLSLVAGAPLLALICARAALIVCRRYNISARVSAVMVKVRTRSKKLVSKLPLHFTSEKRWTSAKSVMVISLMLLVIMIPRVEMLIAQGGTQEIKENQLKSTYRTFYELIENKGREFEGGILTFKAPMGLPYYLPEVKVIDLNYPANLAFLKDCLLSDSPYDTVVKLRQQDINYLLVNPSITRELDASLHHIISKMMQNPELAILSQSLGSWRLYTLGPYAVEKTFIPLSGWSVDSRYTNASYFLNSTESGIYLQLDATDTNSRVTIRNLNAPKLNLSDYHYVVLTVEGSGNARILMRFFLDDGSSFDAAYWKDPYTFMTAPFDLSPYFEKTLRGDAYVGLKSSDETPSSINILEISFVKVKG